MKPGHAAFVASLNFLFVGCAMAQASDLPRPPTAAEFQKMIPEKGEFTTTRTVKGRDAVRQLRARVGLDAVDLARFNMSDPLSTDSTSLQATIRQTGSTSREQVLAAAASNPERGTAQLKAGDTIVQTWRDGGWTYTCTVTWNGREWDLTAVSAEEGKLPQA